ncbi:hypothetical protein [Arsenicicoccus dermatophilus]|uniref:hypothetical protein n=1 Tax=Arsenicicoccus dermatophilus TaxID=1076331 RepID=UPI001F4C74C5|nr:hypothetical protein [Arsenicicoccus dermatophilus]MCH8614442.1 hypothetical protein [Arsenicicoccus dermatophilus]
MGGRTGTDNRANRAVFIWRGSVGHELPVEARGEIWVLGAGLAIVLVLLLGMALTWAYGLVAPGGAAIILATITALPLGVALAGVMTRTIARHIDHVHPVRYHLWVLRREAATTRAAAPVVTTSQPLARLSAPTTTCSHPDAVSRSTCVRCN